MENAAIRIGDDMELQQPHIEIVNGTQVIKDSTTTLHNEIINMLSFNIYSYIINNHMKCKLFTDTVKLYCNELADLSKGNYFLPDLMVICNYKDEDIRDDGVHTTPQFVCEVTSPSTILNDYNAKKNVYQKIGVDEYWIIEPQTNTVHVYLKTNDYKEMVYSLLKPVTISLHGLEIDISSIWQ